MLYIKSTAGAGLFLLVLVRLYLNTKLTSFMKKSYQLLSLLLALLVFSTKSFSQNNLAAGDLAIASYQSDFDPTNTFTVGIAEREDRFSLVVLKPGGLAAGTVIYITDRGWNGPANNWLDETYPPFTFGLGHEAVIRWTVPAGGIPQGKEVFFINIYHDELPVGSEFYEWFAYSDEPGTIPMGTCTNETPIVPVVSPEATDGLNLTFSGDNLLVYQTGPAAGPTGGYNAVPIRFITAILANLRPTTDPPATDYATWDTGPTRLNESSLPPGLTNGQTCFVMSPGPLPAAVINGVVEPDNGKFSNCALTAAGACTALQMSALIYNIANWTYSNNVFPLGTSSSLCTYSILPSNTATLSSAPGTNAQTVNVGSPITNITYSTTGATGATFSGLPAGVTGNWAANVVTISGTPVTTVGSPFSYTVTLTGGCAGVNPTGTITVTCPTITVTNPVITTGTINTPFSQTFTASGGTGPYTFTTVSPLPAGITLSAAGVLSGTPTVSGPFNIIVTATDANLCAGSGANYPLVINTCSAADQTVTAAPATICTGSSSTITVGASQPGVNYTLRIDPANTIVAGPTASNGPAINFGTGALAATTTYNVLAETDKYSINLNGGQAGFSIPAAAPLDLSDNFTMEGWIKPAGNGSFARMFNKDQSYALGISNNQNSITFTRHNAGDFSVPFTFTNGTWYHIACTYVSGTVEFFVNGVSVGTVGGVPAIVLQPASGGQIGSDAGGGFNRFNGNIDNVRIWSSVRTQPQIAANQTAFLTSTGNPTLVASWWIIEGAGNAKDYSANAINATALDGTWQVDAPVAPCNIVLTNKPTVTVNGNNSITLTSAPGTDAQSICFNTAIAAITYSTVSATGATFSGLPAGVNGSWAANTVTISGIPTVTGTFNYTVTLTGGCGPLTTATGSINVKVLPDATITGGGVTVCQGTTVTLSGVVNGAYSYQWGRSLFTAPFANLGTAQTEPVTTSGVYQLTVTQAGCSVSSTTIVNVADYVFNGSLGAGDAIQTGRINRFAVVSTCASPKACPGIFTATGSRFYDAYTITNVRNVPVCVTIGDNSGCTTNAFSVAYLGSFNPAAPCTNYLADPGSSPTSSIFYEATIPANGTIVVVIHEVNPGTGCASYQLTVDVPRDPSAITITPGNPSCTPSTITAPFANTYLWSPGGATTQSIVHNSGTTSYSVTLGYGNNACTASAATGPVTISPPNTVNLTSGPGTNVQTVAVGSPIANITYATTGATGASFSGLPAGVTGNWAANVVTISGSPTTTVGSPFNYTVTLTGGCGVITATGTITVVACSITLSSAPGTDAQTVCNNTAITNITYATIGATGANFTGLPAGVTGSWAANVATISGTPTVAGTFGYVVTLTGGVCGAFNATGTITVNPIPTVNQPANQVLCNNTATAAVNFTGSVPGTVFNWTNNDPSIGLAASGTGDIASFTATNAGTAPVVATVTVTPSATAGGGGPASITMPAQSSTITPNVRGYWFTAPTNFTITSLRVPTDASAGNQSIAVLRFTGNTPPPLFSTTTNAFTTLFLTQNDATPGNIAVNIPINAGEVIGILGARSDIGSYGNGSAGITIAGFPVSTVRLGMQLPLSANVPQSIWQEPSNTNISRVFFDYTSGVTCTGTPKTFTYTVNPTPTATATPASQTVCSATPITPVVISGNAVAGVVYNWTRDNTGTVTGIAASGAGNISGTLTNTTNVPITVTFTITPTANGCAGTPITATVLVNPTPTAVATPASQTVCSGLAITTIVLNGSAVAGTVYNWTRDNTVTVTGIAASGSGNISGTLVNTTAAAITVTFTITPTANGCPGTPITATVVVNPTPTASVLSLVAALPVTLINEGFNVVSPLPAGWAQQNLSTPAGTNPLWFQGNTTVFNSQSGPADSYAAANFNGVAGANTISNWLFTPNITLTNGDVFTFWSRTVPAPAFPDRLEVRMSTNGASVNAGVTNTSVGDFTNLLLTINPGLTVGGYPNAWTQYTITIAGLGAPASGRLAFRYFVTNGGPAGANSDFIGVDNVVYTTAGASSTICAGGTANIKVDITGGTSPYTVVYNANPPGGPGGNVTVSGYVSGTNIPVSPAVTTNYTLVSVTGANGCVGTGNSGTATVTVNPIPTVNAVANQVVCNNTSTAAVNFSGAVPGTVYNWTNNAPSIGLAAAGTGNIASFTATNATTAPVTAIITVTPTYTNAGTTCTGTPTSFTITVNPTPNATATPASQTICSGSAITTIVNSGTVPGTVFNWTRDNGIVTGIAASGSGNISGTLTNPTNLPITVTFTITPSYTNAGVTCTGTPVTATVVVNPIPTVNAVANQVVCNGAPTTAVNFTGSVTNPPGTVYNWTNNTPSIGLAASGTGNIASFTATNATTAPVTATITVTPGYTNAGTTCTGTPITFTITVNPTATVTVPANAFVCNGSVQNTGTYNFSTTATGGVTTYTWTNNDISIGLGASGSGNSLPTFTATNPTTVPITGTITVTPTFTNGGVSCVGTPNSFSITVNPTPNATAAPTSQTICSAATITTIVSTGTVPGTVFNWTRDNNATATGIAASGVGNISGTLTNTTNGPVLVTFTITPTYTNGGTTCSGTPVTATVLVNPLAVVDPVANQVVCNNDVTAPVNFTSPTTGGTIVYNWTNNLPSIGLAAAGTGNIAAFTATNPGTAPVVATITVTPSYTNGGITCVGTPSTFTITVNPSGQVNQPASQVVCNNSPTAPVNFTTTTPGTIFNWTNNTTSIGLAAAGTGNIPSFIATNPTNAPVVATVVVTPVYVPSVSGTQTFNYNGSVVDWVVPAGVTSVDVQAFGAQGGLGGGLGASIAGTVSVTPGETIKIMVGGTGEAYSNGNGGGGGGSFVWKNAGNVLLVAAGGGGGTSNNSNGSIGGPGSATNTPTASINGSGNAAGGGGGNGGSGGGGTLNGESYPAGGGGGAGWLSNGGNGAFTYGATGGSSPLNGGAGGIGFNPCGNVNIAGGFGGGGGAGGCSGASGGGGGYNGGGGGNNWSGSTWGSGGGGGSFNAGTGQTNTAGFQSGNGQVVLTWLGSGGSPCVGPGKTFTITVNPTPTVDPVANQIVCAGSPTAAVNFTGFVPGTVYNWTNNNTNIGLAGVGSGNIASFIAINLGSVPEVATITVTPAYTNGGVTCTGTPITFTITVNPQGQVNQPADQTVCNGTPTAPVNFTTTVPGTVFNWTNNNTTIGLGASGAGNIPSFIGTNAGTTPNVGTITVTPTYVPVSTVTTTFNFTGGMQTFTVPAGVTSIDITALGAQGGSGAAGGASVAGGAGGLGASATGTLAVVPGQVLNIFVGGQGATPAGGFNGGGNGGNQNSGGGGGASDVRAGGSGIANRVITAGGGGGGGRGGCDEGSASTGGIGGNGGTGGGGVGADGASSPTSGGVAGGGFGGNAGSVQGAFGAAGIGCGGFLGAPGITTANEIGGNGGNGQTCCCFSFGSIPGGGGGGGGQIGGGGAGGGSAGTTGCSGNSKGAGGGGGGGSSYTGGVTSGTTTAGVQPGDGQVVITYALPAGPSCPGTPKTFTITVNPTPVVNAVASQVVCNGSPTANINFTSPVSGGVIVYNWTNSDPSIGIPASGSGDILSFIAINATNVPVVATLTVTMSYSNGGVTCVSAPVTFTITVNPTPDVNQPANQTVCANTATAPVNFTGTVAGTVFNWTNNNTSIGLAASGTGNIASFTALNATNLPVVATIVVTPFYTNAGVTCSGPSKTFTITVNPIPTVAAVSNKAYCTGATTLIIPFNGTAGNLPGTVYNWTNSNTGIGLAASGTGDILPFVTTNATNGPLVATITVTPVGPTGCVGTPVSFTITVNPRPIVNPVAGQVVCNGTPTAAINFVSPTTGPTGALTFQWTNSAPSIGLAANGTGNIPSFTAINTGVSPVTAIITVTPVYTNAGITCTGTSQSFTIVVNPTPTVNPVASQVLCNGSNTAAVTFTGSVFGTIYNWTNNNTSIGLAAAGAGNIASFTATNATNVPQVATITVTPNYSNTITCPGTPITFTITVNPVPAVNPVANQTVCAGTTVTQVFSGPVAGTVYNWTNSNTAIGLAASGTGNLNFVSTNTTGAPLTGTITVTPTFTNGGGTCTGTPVTFTITVNPVPTVNAVLPQVLCNGAATAAVNFTGAVAGTVYSWTNTNTTIGLAAAGTGNIASFTATNATAVVQTATITVTPTYTNGGTTCTGTPITFTITVNPTPSVNAIANQTVCNATATAAVTITGPVAGTVYSWTNNNTSIGLAASGTNTIPSFVAINTGSTPQTATITVTPTFTNGGITCSGASTTFTITVNPTAVVNQPANQLLCNGAATSAVVFSGLPPGSTYSWTNSNTAIGLAASGTGNIGSFTATNNTTAPITATITVTPTSTGCGGTAVSFTITVNPTPAVNAIANQVLCAGATTAAVTISGPVANTVYTWTNNNTTIGLGASGTGNIPGFVTVNPTLNPVTATITVTPTYTNGGISCTGNPVSFTITVNPLPNIVFPRMPPRVCLTDTIVTLVATPAGGTWSGPGIVGNTFNAALAGLGVARVTYTVTNGFGCSTSRFENVVVHDCKERHNVFQEAIRIWPNPNQGRFSIQFNSDKYKEFKVKVVNARGQEMGYYEFKNLVYGQIIPFDLSRLAGGTYYLYVYNTQESGVFPIVIAR